MAIESQGILVFWSTSTAMSTAVAVNDVTGFNGPSGSANVIDITNLQSTAKEKQMGLPDEGQVSLDAIYNSTDAGQVALRADRASRTKRNVAIKLTDGSSQLIHADAYCTNFSITGAVDDVLKASYTLELTGPLTFTTN
ncbi:MAG: phage tail tube protein [Candidatus Omnitrophica bacterium]|nr:phage tail tube protein [Candidatus Omnitrophota bacterium]